MTEVRTIEVTREELLQNRQELLARLDLTVEDLNPDQYPCACCIPAWVGISWQDWSRFEEIQYLLGER